MATAKASVKRPAAKPAPKRKIATKIFVLDTNVLMHDPTCIYRFDEHDIFLPMMTLEELDNHKKGMTDVARNTRTVTRTLDQIISQHDNGLDSGIPLTEISSGQATGRLFFQNRSMDYNLPTGLPNGKGDNQILSVVMGLKTEHPSREVVLVSKDFNIRIKARSLGLSAEDYLNDQVVDDTNLLPTGLKMLGASFWNKNSRGLKSSREGKESVYKFSAAAPDIKDAGLNSFLHIEQDGFVGRVVERNSKTVTVRTVANYGDEKNAICGIVAKNAEQTLRPRSPDGPADRLRDPAWASWHRQDADHPCGGNPATDVETLCGNSGYSRHGPGWRGNRLPSG